MLDILRWDGGAWAATHQDGEPWPVGTLNAGGGWVHLTETMLHHDVGGTWQSVPLPEDAGEARALWPASGLVAIVVNPPGFSGPDEVRVSNWSGAAWSDTVPLPLPAAITSASMGGPIVATDRIIVARYVLEEANGGAQILTRGALLVWRRMLGGWTLAETIEAPRVDDGFGSRMALDGRGLVVLSTNRGRAPSTSPGDPAAVARWELPPIDADGDGEFEDVDPDDFDPTVTSSDDSDMVSETDQADTDVAEESDQRDDTDRPDDTDKRWPGGCSCAPAGHTGRGWMGLGPFLAWACSRRRAVWCARS